MDKTLVFYYCFGTVHGVRLIYVGFALACYITNELRVPTLYWLVWKTFFLSIKYGAEASSIAGMTSFAIYTKTTYSAISVIP